MVEKVARDDLVDTLEVLDRNKVPYEWNDDTANETGDFSRGEAHMDTPAEFPGVELEVVQPGYGAAIEEDPASVVKDTVAVIRNDGALDHMDPTSTGVHGKNENPTPHQHNSQRKVIDVIEVEDADEDEDPSVP